MFSGGVKIQLHRIRPGRGPGYWRSQGEETFHSCKNLHLNWILQNVFNCFAAKCSDEFNSIKRRQKCKFPCFIENDELHNIWSNNVLFMLALLHCTLLWPSLYGSTKSFLSSLLLQKFLFAEVHWWPARESQNTLTCAATKLIFNHNFGQKRIIGFT